jgi:hypothetical protein
MDYTYKTEFDILQDKIDSILYGNEYPCSRYKGRKSIPREAEKQTTGQMGFLVTIFDIVECKMNIDTPTAQDTMENYIMAVRIFHKLLEMQGMIL